MSIGPLSIRHSCPRRAVAEERTKTLAKTRGVTKTGSACPVIKNTIEKHHGEYPMFGLKIPKQHVHMMDNFCRNQKLEWTVWNRDHRGEEWNFKTEADQKKANDFLRRAETLDRRERMEREPRF